MYIYNLALILQENNNFEQVAIIYADFGSNITTSRWDHDQEWFSKTQ